jgi:hypothetical protein
VALTAKGHDPRGKKAIDELLFKTRKKWERRKKTLKRAEARSTIPSTHAANAAVMDSCTSRMKKLEDDMELLRDELISIEASNENKNEKMKKSNE